MSNYIPKDLLFDNEGRDKLISGISKISKAVKSTLGPRGKTVLIESSNHTQGITITKDGVTVAESISLIDSVENLAITMMKDAARRTANSAGDGTTTAIVLTEALVKAGEKFLKPEHNITEVVKNIKKTTEDVIDRLKKDSRKVTPAMLKDVATISSNNDSELGHIISDAYKKVGVNGIVTIESSQNHETYATVTNGIKVDRGYTSQMFITNQKNDEAVLEDTLVLVCDQEISNILQIETILKPIIQQNKKLLIIGACSPNVVNTLAANVVRNGLKLCNIIPPNFGYKQHELMQDIALSVGAKYFSEKTGDNLNLITMEDLGQADKVIAGKNQTVIIKNNQLTKDIENRIKELKEQQENTEIVADREFINERIASLSGSIGAIYVGGNSDVEQKEKYDRVEDAVCAVRSALEEGIVRGGGSALFYIGEYLEIQRYKGKPQEEFDDEDVADVILGHAMCIPFFQILENAGINFRDANTILVKSHKKGKDYGYDVKNEKYGDMFKMGVVDPLKVTRLALLNAVSVATTILSTNAIITHARKIEE
jgi:chaperonin GroEL|tara:strand:+ start:1700 stop:3325 length:1626 start_codon:yes stop_codon:yes gene_type:complete